MAPFRRCSASASMSPRVRSFALMGRNGMGKSTTIRAILGLTPGFVRGHKLRRTGYPRDGLLSQSPGWASGWFRKAGAASRT